MWVDAISIIESYRPSRREHAGNLKRIVMPELPTDAMGREASTVPHSCSSADTGGGTMSPGWAARLAASACPLLGIAAWSGTGKTTLLEQLLPALRERGLRVAVIKHAHHAFDVDTPGKDSHRLRSTGATPMLVASARRFALMMETPDQQEADLEQLVAQLDGLAVDLILVEGFKQWPLPKLELHRAAVGKPLRALHDPWIRALAVPGPMDEPDGEFPVALPADLTRLDLDDIDALAAWVAAWPVQWRLNGGQPRQEVAS